MKNTSTKILFWCLLLFLLLAVLYGFRHPLLQGMGGYLAPSESMKADAVIIEGSKIIETVAVRQAVRFLKSGRATKIILVIHEVPDGEKIFSLPASYAHLVHGALIKEGLKTTEFKILNCPVGHPVTLAEAECVLTRLSEEKLRSVILVAKSFHTRRSLLAYKKAGKGRNIAFYPSPYFAGYRLEAWWLKADGFRDYFSEALKLFYYILRGYIPLRSFFTINI
ncbi:MAG: hypothetical protein JXA41_00720 [Deltaproteobacteria bacterium]|nr:hypothetical protein [Deltaproteobacteria bacterium]